MCGPSDAHRARQIKVPRSSQYLKDYSFPATMAGKQLAQGWQKIALLFLLI